MGSTHNLFTGRTNSLRTVLTFAALTMLSSPGHMAVTLPRGHDIVGVLSSFTRTSCPSFTLIGLRLFHLLRRWRCCKYSLDHLFQKCCFRASSSYILDSRFSGSAVISGSKLHRRESPMRKWLEVKIDKSEGSSERGVKGREFNMASIWAVTVHIS